MAIENHAAVRCSRDGLGHVSRAIGTHEKRARRRFCASVPAGVACRLWRSAARARRLRRSAGPRRHAASHSQGVAKGGIPFVSCASARRRGTRGQARNLLFDGK